MPSKEYSRQHYVPVWYQKRFVSPVSGDRSLFYFDLAPKPHIDSKGGRHFSKNPRFIGPRQCFFEEDLYAVFFPGVKDTALETEFFGAIDLDGSKAVRVIHDFPETRRGGDVFTEFLNYLSAQKLRTPKGLGWLRKKTRNRGQNELMSAFLRFRQLYCAFWAESIWIIADASKSNTKFIVSDNPVSIYNRGYGPKNQKYSGVNDPEVWLNGSQTIFPLSSEKVLMMTNLSWVRNPYQDPRKARPNPHPFRDAVMMLDTIQTRRYLSEEEVRQINLVIKTGAYRFIAAGEKEWLFPERHVNRSDWPGMQYGYLCMPDPRAVHYSGPIYLGYKGGGSSAFDEYGRRPWQEGFSEEYDSKKESKKFYRFQREFAELFGPNRRGMSGGPLGEIERDLI